MKADKVYNQFLKTAKYLLKELDYYGENQFKKKITENHLTVGQLYDYLVSTSESYYLAHIYDCLNQKNGSIGGNKKFKGKLVFWYGKLPGILKYRNITNYKPEQPESPEKMKDRFYKFIKLMSKAAHDIDEKGEPDKLQIYKTKHPHFGMLSALEWYRLIEINIRHHIPKKEEIDKVLRGIETEGN